MGFSAYIRPILAVGFCGATIALTIMGKIEADKILTVSSMITAFYFGERSALKNPSNGTEEK